MAIQPEDIALAGSAVVAGLLVYTGNVPAALLALSGGGILKAVIPAQAATIAPVTVATPVVATRPAQITVAGAVLTLQPDGSYK